MSKLNGKGVSYARAHGTIKVPTSSQIGPELSEAANGVTRAVKMVVEDDCIVITVPKHGTMAKDESIHVPLTNFSHFIVKPNVSSTKA